MPFQIDTSEGSLIFSDQHIQAVVRHAERQAELTAAVLDATGLFPKKPARLPAAFLLELGAVLELGLWELRSIRAHLRANLPTYREAAAELAARAEKKPPDFDGPDAAQLSRRVFQVWMEQFAWEGPDLLHGDIIVGDVDEDQFAQVLADFVWQHRRELSNLLNRQQ